MSQKRTGFTEEQQKVILEGVKNDVDYHVIAEQVGCAPMSITMFLHRRLLSEFKSRKSREVTG